MLNLKATGGYASKDQLKANQCNKFIGRGSVGSSTHRYSLTLDKAVVNCGHYDASDVVFVSANGKRPGRLCPDWDEMIKAVNANVTFITDGNRDRDRDYNVGERQVAAFLLSHGFIGYGGDYTTWTK